MENKKESEGPSHFDGPSPHLIVYEFPHQTVGMHHQTRHDVHVDLLW